MSKMVKDLELLAFRHTDCDGLGSLMPAFTAQGVNCRYVDSYKDDLSNFDALTPDIVVVLGGAPGVYQAETYDFIKHETDIIAARIDTGKPVMGICLGAQMMAKAIGSDVYVGKHGVEKGWGELRVIEDKSADIVRRFDGAHGRVLHWHGDTFDLPSSAELLASSTQYKNQIFRAGKNAYGFQCHIEATHDILLNWFVNSAGDVASGAIDLENIRADTNRYVQTMIENSEIFVQKWVQQIREDY
jgi:GMP synthase (glutamine-hydrolysing)